jgi:hypothetical protein
MTSKNPAPTATNPVTDRRVQPARAAAGEVEQRPTRVQLSRAKGWRMPPKTVIVSRPSKYGNPHDWRIWRGDWPSWAPITKHESDGISRDEWCKDRATQAFQEDLADGSLVLPVADLRGKNLACWCKVGSPCHADVLLELANASPVDGTTARQTEPREEALSTPNERKREEEG